MVEPVKWNTKGFASLEEAQDDNAEVFLRTAAGLFKRLKKSVLAEAIAVSAGGVTAADTTIKVPTDFADFDAAIAHLKANSYTGLVTLQFEAGYTISAPPSSLNDFHMPNLDIFFDGCEVDTTGWAPNFFGVYLVLLSGQRCTLGRIYGPISHTTGAENIFFIGGMDMKFSIGTTLGLPGTETDLIADGFSQGFSVVESDIIGYGKLIMTGLRVAMGEGFNAFGGILRNIRLELDGNLVSIGRNPFLANRAPIATFQSITFIGPDRGVERGVVAHGGLVDFGAVSNTSGDTIIFVADLDADLKVTLPAGATYLSPSLFTGGGAGRIQAFVAGAITWKPTATSAAFTRPGCEVHVSTASGLGSITVDNSGGVTPTYVFTHSYGSVRDITLSGDFGARHQYPVNKVTDSSVVWDKAVSPTQVSAASDGETVVVQASTQTLYHTAVSGVEIATLTVDLNSLLPDQEIVIESCYGVTAVTFNPSVTGSPGALTAGQPVRLRKFNGLWHMG